jgi:hypothetical protein
MSLENRTKTYSLSMNVEGFLRHNRYPEDFDVFQHDDGTPLSPSEALTYLTTEKAKGHKVIPCSAECGNPCKHSDNGCTGFDYRGGGCPGRYENPAATDVESGGAA